MKRPKKRQKRNGILEPGHLDDVKVESDKKKTKKENSDDEDEATKKRQKKECRGTLKMHDITSEDDPDDWEYEVTIKKKSKRNKAAMAKVKSGRESVVELIGVFVKELKSKKMLTVHVDITVFYWRFSAD